MAAPPAPTPQANRNYIQCAMTFRQKAKNWDLEDMIPALQTANLTTIGEMAPACCWNPELITDEQVKTKVLMKVLSWNGMGDEPPKSSNVKQLLWDCAQEYL